MAAEGAAGKKRKGPSDSAPPKAKKPKKSDSASAATKSAKSVNPSPTDPMATEAKPAKKKSARKQAADFFSDDETAPPAASPAKPTKAKKTKAAPKTNGDAADTVAPKEVAPVTPTKSIKKEKNAKDDNAANTPVAESAKAGAHVKKPQRSKKAELLSLEDMKGMIPSEPTLKMLEEKYPRTASKMIREAYEEAQQARDDEEEDDHTAALLAGFESDGDNDDPEEDLDWGDDAGIHALTKTQQKQLAKAEKAPQSTLPGVIYVGRVPRGFFEPQMKKYFTQFGTVTRLRLSRNKKSGASKHYAFVEFASAEVADIVARTMDNYLMFGHILKCKVIPPDHIHPNLFKGAGERFKVDPKNKKAGLQMERGVPREQWEKRVEKETKKRAGRAKKVKETFGYEYTPTKLKSVDEVPKKLPTLEDQEQQKLLAEVPADDPPMAEEPKEKKKGKGKAKDKAAAQPADSAQPAAEPKAKKSSKRKALEETNEADEIKPEPTEPTEAVPAKKARKSKKVKSEPKDDEPALPEETNPSKTIPATKKSKAAVDAETKPAKEKKRKVDQEQKSEPKTKKAKKGKA